MAESEGGCCCEGARGIGAGCPGDDSTCNCCVTEATLGCDEGFEAVSC